MSNRATTQVRMTAARSSALRGLELEVGSLLARARRAMGERARGLHPDLQAGAYLVAAHIAEHGPLRASELTATLSLDKAAISRHVQALIELGLIESSRDPDDGRAWLLSITDAGRDGLVAVGEVRRAGLSERLAAWSDEDLAELVELLHRYNETLN